MPTSTSPSSGGISGRLETKRLIVMPRMGYLLLVEVSLSKRKLGVKLPGLRGNGMGISVFPPIAGGEFGYCQTMAGKAWEPRLDQR